MRKIDLKKLGISIALSLGAGFVGSFFTAPAIDGWYMNINKPIFTPPDWVFAPVWTLLFILMGVAFYRIWSLKIKKKKVNFALKVFIVHLGLNIGWSLLFFGLKNPGLALIEIVILWLVIKYLIKLFSELDSLAGRLLLPYLAWVSFATLLNFAVWLAN